MAANTEELTEWPQASVDSDVQARLGLTVEFNHAAILQMARQLKMGSAALLATPVTANADTVIGVQDGKHSPITGSFDGVDGVDINMGSVLMSAQRLYEKRNGKGDMNRYLSGIASFVVAHELRHAADYHSMGRARLQREDKRYEFLRLTRAVLPKLAGTAIGAVFLGAVDFGLRTLEYPWWTRLILGVSGLFLVGEAAGEARQIYKRTKAHTYQTGEKTYKNHPSEKRAFRHERKYARKLRDGKAPMLVSVTRVRFADSKTA